MDDARPLLVFFSSAHSGPSRRMESLLAHIARKERHRLRVVQVDVEERRTAGEPSGEGQADEPNHGGQHPEAAPPGPSLDLDPTSTDPRIHGDEGRRGPSLCHLKLT